MSSPLRVSLVQLGYGDAESVSERTSRVADRLVVGIRELDERDAQR